MADNSDELDREVKRRAAPEMVGPANPSVPGAQNARTWRPIASAGRDHPNDQVWNSKCEYGSGIRIGRARVELTSVPLPGVQQAAYSPNSPLTKEKFARVEEVEASQVPGASHIPSSHYVGRKGENRVEYAEMSMPRAHHTTSALSSKYSKGPHGLPRLESVGPSRSPCSEAMMVSGEKKYRGVMAQAGAKRRSEDIKIIALGSGVPGPQLISEGIIDIDEPPPMPGTATAESTGGWHKNLMGLNRANAAPELAESNELVERQHANQYAFTSNDHSAMAVAGVTVTPPGALRASSENNDGNNDEPDVKQETMLWFCSRHSKLIIPLLVIFVVGIVIGVTVPLLTAANKEEANISSGIIETADPNPFQTLAPSVAPTGAPIQEGSTLSPTLVPTPFPTSEYTLPPVPPIQFDAAPPISSTGSWSLVGEPIDGVSGNEQFGTAVALSYSGNVVAASAPPANTRRGLVRLFQCMGSPGDWIQIGGDIHGDEQGWRSGQVLAISGLGLTVAISSPLYSSKNSKDKVGKVRVFSRYGGSPMNSTWTPQGKPIFGSAAGDEAGSSVALSEDGTRMIVGSPFHESSSMRKDTGCAQVFQFNSSLQMWNQVGQDITGSIPNDRAGSSVAISASGNRIAVGSPFTDHSGSDAGQVQIYDYEDTGGGRWVPFGKGVSGSYPSDEFGNAISLSGDGHVLAVGAVGRENGRGAVQIFRSVQRQWEKIGQDILGISENDNLGVTVSISFFGDRLIVSSQNHNKATGYVQAYAFNASNNLWNQAGNSLFGEGDGVNFGYSVSISGNGYRFAAGSRYFDPTPEMNSGGQLKIYEL